MKKLFLLLILAVLSVTAQALTFSVGDLEYTTSASGNSVYVNGLTEAAARNTTIQIDIPSTVSYDNVTYRVWGVSDNAFNGKTSITYVRFRFGTRVIGSSAFQGCTNLTEVLLPSSLYRMDASCFAGCSKLKTVCYAGFDFPKGGVTSTAFPSNSGMTLYISTQSTRTPTQYKAVSPWSKFNKVEKSSNAYDAVLSDGGRYAVGYTDTDDASTLRKLTLVGYSTSGTGTSSGTVYKPTAAIWNLTGMRFSIDTIGENAFQGQTTLTTIDLINCTNLAYFKAQDYNTGVEKVTKLVLPKSNFWFNARSFLYFTSLAEFQLASGSTKYSILDGCLYDYNKTTLYRVPNAKTGSVAYPNTLTTVFDWSHARTQLSQAYLPYGVKTVGPGAFNTTPKLSEIRIPSSVTILSTDRVFFGINPNAYVYINMNTPPTISVGYCFDDVSNIDLLVPYGKENAYINAGWTGFYAVNRDGRQAYDNLWESSTPTTFGYTVTGTTSYTANDGVSYAGTCKLVCAADSRASVATERNVPDYVTISGKRYAVTKIGEDAFNGNTVNFTITGCKNVEEVGDYAFQDQPITKYPFSHKMRRIGTRAFSGASFTGTLQIPHSDYSLTLGVFCFAEGKYSRIIIPNNVTHYGDFCKNTTTLSELVFNVAYSYNYTGWDLGTVPGDCYIRVPVGYVDHYRQGTLKRRANYITAGAYDFAWNNSYNSYYHVSIISNTPTTYNGTTYAGKAKYVYYTSNPNKTDCGFTLSEKDQTVSDDIRSYLITEIGDSCLMGAKSTSLTIPAAVTRIGDDAFLAVSTITTNNLTLPSGLTYIGARAFCGTKLTGEIKIPASVTNIQPDAFWNVPLTALYFPGNKPNTLGTNAWDMGYDVPLTVWVPNEYANNYLTAASASGWQALCKERLAVWIKPTTKTTTFSSVIPVDFSTSDITALYASAYDKNQTGQEVTLRVTQRAPANTGLLLTNITPGTEYRISRPITAQALTPNYLVANPTAGQNINAVTVGYYWDANKQCFVKPTGTYTLPLGHAYLKLSSAEAGSLTEVYTNIWHKAVNPYDVDGSGVIDLSDMNVIIDAILGKIASAIADIDNSGVVDLNDLNKMIDYLLSH